jgi:hypothetical protein
MLGAVFGLNGSVLADGMTAEALPDLYIKAVNPGYNVDGANNVGEMIEIARKESDTPISLAGTTVGYTNSSGNYSELFRFPEYSWMTGETILLRLASSPGAELAAANYTKTLAMKGGIDLKVGDEIVDRVCWTGKDGCWPEFKSANPTTLVRNTETNEFEHLIDYEPKFEQNNYFVEEEKEDEKEKGSQCRGVEFSEILSYWETTRAEQFIEFHNNTTEQVLLDGCKIRYKNKMYDLKGIILADGYLAYAPEFSLTKNPTNSNLLELVDVDGAVVDELRYPNGQRKGTTYAWMGYDGKGAKLWHVTYAPTPGAPNIYQEYKTCETGKIINKETGNCVKITTISEKICPEGQYLNILTGRCRKNATTTQKTCKEGYYLNPETNRCRKIKNNDGADYSLTPENYEEKSSFVAWYAILGVIILVLIYVIYEFRREIGKLISKVWRRFR